MPVERDGLRTWEGMNRYEWNASPQRNDWHACPTCGYRRETLACNWEHYRGRWICWDCFMVETGAAAKYWATYDANYRGVAKTQAPGLERL